MKKSFILHKDSLDVLDDLSKEQIADLFIAIRDYNNGNEVKLSGLMKAVFTPFKNQFSRDNEKFNAVCERNRQNGKSGGRPKSQAVKENPEQPKKPTGLNGLPTKPKKADSDKDRDKDRDRDRDRDKEIIKDSILESETKFNFRKEFLKLGVDSGILDDWLKVRTRKRAVNSETAFKAIKKKIENSAMTFNECIKISAEKSWAGFDKDWIKEEKNKESENNYVIYQIEGMAIQKVTIPIFEKHKKAITNNNFTFPPKFVNISNSTALTPRLFAI